MQSADLKVTAHQKMNGTDENHSDNWETRKNVGMK